jgi:hypothetical protein
MEDFYDQVYRVSLPESRTTDILILKKALAQKFGDPENFKSYILIGGPAVPYKGEHINWASFGFVNHEDLARLRATVLSMICRDYFSSSNDGGCVIA